MKGKKTALIISFVAMVICIPVSLYCFLKNDGFYIYFYDISLGIFGGAFLGFIITIGEYNIARRQSVENFCQEALKAYSLIGSAQYFYSDIPIDLMLECIAQNMSYGNTDEEKYEYKSKLVYKVRSGNDTPHITYSDYCKNTDIAMVDKEYEKIVKEFNDNMEECMKKYIEIAKHSSQDLSNALATLDFIFSNSSMTTDLAYNRIYDRYRQVIKLIKDKAYHFNIFLNEGKNYRVNVLYLNELNETLFKSTLKNNDEWKTIIVYSEFANQFSDAIDELLAKLNKEDYKKREHKPVLQAGSRY